jgi:hypothetical protein
MLLSDYRLLELALEAATSGTTSDTNLQYKKACTGYKKAMKYLSIIIQRASSSSNQSTTLESHHIEQVNHWHLVYQQRLAGLESTRHKTGDKTISEKPKREARVRRTSLSKIPFVEDAIPKEHCPRPPKAIWRRPYWLLRRLQSSVNGGGFIAPSIYVTGLVWSQKGAKISGLNHKMKIYQNIYEELTKLSQVQLPSDGKSWRTKYQRDTSDESLQVVEAGLTVFLNSLIKSQNALAHSLSYVQKAEGSVADHKRGIIKRALTKVSKVYDRTANESITKRVSGTDLQQYAALIACISERAQFLDGWLTYFETPGCELNNGGALPPGVGSEKSNYIYGGGVQNTGRGENVSTEYGTGGEGGERRDGGSSLSDISTTTGLRASQIQAPSSALPRIHRILEKIGHGLRDAVCLVVWKDLQELLERYLRKSRKAFVSNLEWEDNDNEDMMMSAWSAKSI